MVCTDMHAYDACGCARVQQRRHEGDMRERYGSHARTSTMRMPMHADMSVYGRRRSARDAGDDAQKTPPHTPKIWAQSGSNLYTILVHPSVSQPCIFIPYAQDLELSIK